MTTANPTVVLVHGAFAESASWNDVICRLDEHGITAIAAPNELRSLAADAATVGSLVAAIGGPVVLAGHSYGGAVISDVAREGDDVGALVYVAAFAPEVGESCGDLTNRLPGSTLPPTLMTVPLPDGTSDFYIRPELYHEQFCADVPDGVALQMAATQRPLRDTALTEGAVDPAWKRLPSWFVFPDQDKNIPVATHRLMAERAGAVDTVEVAGASHAITVSRPDVVADSIRAAVKHLSA
jgi:pimeloyl-ACP methyl ester carboxylesterase